MERRALAQTVSPQPGNAHSFISKGKDHVPSTSQKAGLTGLYKKLFFMSTTAISKPVFQEVDSTVILPLTFINKGVSVPCLNVHH